MVIQDHAGQGHADLPPRGYKISDCHWLQQCFIEKWLVL